MCDSDIDYESPTNEIDDESYEFTPILIDTTSMLLPNLINQKKKARKSKRKYFAESKKAKSVPCCPKRYIFAFLGFLGVANVYSMKVNLSVAILAMVNNSAEMYKNNEIIECPELVQNLSVNQQKLSQAQQFDWTEETVNRILGSFFYGYVLTQVPGGYLAEHMSGKWLFGGGIIIAGLLTAASPLAATLGVPILMTNRMLEGLAAGVTKPAMNAMISRWSPKFERSRVSSFIFSGGLVGSVFTLPLSGWLSSSRLFGGWPSVFYSFGILSGIWFLFWIKFVFDSPMEHPNISKRELMYFEENQEIIHKDPKVPWKAIFTSLPVWAVIISHFGSALGFLTLFTALPTYFKAVLHFNIEADGYVSALPFLCQAIGAWISAIMADRMREAGKLSITSIRKVFNTIGLLGPAATLFCVTLSGCRPQLIVTLVCLAMAQGGFVYSGYQVTHIDMSPDFAGVLFGISSSIADLSGIFGPALVTAFTYNETTTGNWNKIFYTMCVGYIIAAIFYLLYASAELQSWGLDKKAISLKASLSNEVNIIRKKKNENLSYN